MRQKSCKTARFYHLQMIKRYVGSPNKSRLRYRQIYSDKLQNLAIFVRISLTRLDAIWRSGSIQIKINNQKKWLNIKLPR